MSEKKNQSNWLEKFRKNPKAYEQLREKARAAGGEEFEQLPNMTFPIDVPMFVKTLEESRVIPVTRYGPREVVNVVVTETTDLAQSEGLEATMWLTQAAFRGQMDKFRDEDAGVINLGGANVVKIPKDLGLFILNHGKRRSGESGYSYYDYTILTAEEGKALIEEL